MTGFYEEYPKVFVSVDCIVFGFDNNKLKVLIGRRKMNPGRGQWSVYGGFVGSRESVDDAAKRVLLELTGLNNLFLRQVGAFGTVDRDPGERVISIVYYSMINVNDYDTSLMEHHRLKWFALDEIPPLYSDHKHMINKALTMMREKISSEPISFNLLPELFTLTQLQHVYEAICGEEVDKRNFRKRIKEMEFIEKTEQIDKKSSKRGAYMYRFNKKTYKEDPNFKL
jgi:8-oxo-dGTP diphosphatase